MPGNTIVVPYSFEQKISVKTINMFELSQKEQEEMSGVTIHKINHVRQNVLLAQSRFNKQNLLKKLNGFNNDQHKKFKSQQEYTDYFNKQIEHQDQIQRNLAIQKL